MRKIKIIIALSLAALNVAAQDIIVMRNGDEVEAKVTKVGTTEVEYHKWSNQDGPVYTVAKSDVFMVKYKNGEKDVFDNVTAKSDNSPKSESNSSAPQYVEAVPAANNQELISIYNKEVDFAQKCKNKKSDFCYPILGVSKSSLISTDEIELRIVPNKIYESGFYTYRYIRYTLELTNKTNKMLYIDLGNCFRINGDGLTECYLKQESTTISKSSSSGMGLNLGAVAGAVGIGGAVGTIANGVSVGGATQGGVSTTYQQSQILIIAPYGKKNLVDYNEVHVKGNKYQIISDIEHYKFVLGKKGFIKENEIQSYNESNSPFFTSHLITYSTTPDFKSYSMLNAKLFVRYIVGSSISNFNFSKMTKSIQKIIPSYTDDSSLIFGETNYL